MVHRLRKAVMVRVCWCEESSFFIAAHCLCKNYSSARNLSCYLFIRAR